MRRHMRSVVGFVVLVILIVALPCWNVNVGSVHLGLERVFTLLRWGNDDTTEGNILWRIRLPHLLGAALLGGTLSIVGFLLQTFFKNPIAGPLVLGISSGSRLFVGFFLLAATPIVTGDFSPYVIFLTALAGALAAVALVLVVSSRMQNLTMLLVIGMIIGYICDTGTDFAAAFAESSRLQNLIIWAMGSFSGITRTTLGVPALTTIPTVVPMFLLSRPPGVYLLGENYVKSTGVNVKDFRVTLILLPSILSVCITALTDPISFVDIAVPHITRLIFRTSRPIVLIPATFLTGNVFCLTYDLITRTTFSPMKLTISTVTSALGAPMMIWLVIRHRRNG